MQLGVWARGFVDWIRQVGPPFFAALGDLLLKFGNWFIDDALPVIVAKLGEWAQEFIDWIGPLIPPFLTELGELIAEFSNWFVTDGLDMIVTKLGEWGAEFLEWIGPLIPPLLEKLGELLIEMTTWMVTVAAPNLAKAAKRWSDALTDWIIDVAPTVMKELRDLLIKMSVKLGVAATDLGKRLVGAIADGIRENGRAILIALRNLIPGGSALGSVWSAILSGGIPFKFKAAGGPVSMGSPYIVGESGPELFVPTGSGTIMNNNRLGGMGGGDINVTVNMPAGSNGDDVVRALQDYVRRRGAIPVPVGSARY